MEKNLPEKKFRAGSVSATIWKNNAKSKTTGEDVEFHTISLDRNYKVGDEWKTSNSLRVQDVADAMLVLRESYRYLRLKEIDSKNGNSSNTIPEEEIM